MEFLPLTITDLKKVPKPGKFFALHPLVMEDVIDIEASQGKLNEIDKHSLSSWKSLVVRPSTTPFFRPARLDRCVVMVDAEIAAKLSAVEPKLIGLGLRDPSAYRP